MHMPKFKQTNIKTQAIFKEVVRMNNNKKSQRKQRQQQQTRQTYTQKQRNKTKI